MEHALETSLNEQITAALDWWREAGVDGDLHDAPQTWLATAKVEMQAKDEHPQLSNAPAPAAAPSPPAPPDRSNWPTDLGVFSQWWLAEPWLDQSRIVGRVPPRGAKNAKLMILVAEPERDDSDKLLSGTQGRLLSAMLSAVGIGEDEAYVASVLPRHTPHADWNADNARRLGELARHHIALAAPTRLIVFGSNILALLGNDPAHMSGASSEIQLEGGTVPLLAARDIALLREKPRWKAAFWQNWLDWTGTT